jgi:hypothetical protein
MTVFKVPVKVNRVPFAGGYALRMRFHSARFPSFNRVEGTTILTTRAVSSVPKVARGSALREVQS